MTRHEIYLATRAIRFVDEHGVEANLDRALDDYFSRIRDLYDLPVGWRW